MVNFNIIETKDYSNSSGLKAIIEQLEIAPDGRVWVRQKDDYSADAKSNMAFFDGQQWHVFDYNNSPFDNKITGFTLSSSGEAYAITAGSETQLYKFGNSTWAKLGTPVHLADFTGELNVDKNENFWISGLYGLARITTCPPVPDIKPVSNTIEYGETIELNAKNCTSGTIWSWTNDTESRQDSLVGSGASLKLKLLSDTQFTARCGRKKLYGCRYLLHNTRQPIDHRCDQFDRQPSYQGISYAIYRQDNH